MPIPHRFLDHLLSNLQKQVIARTNKKPPPASNFRAGGSWAWLRIPCSNAYSAGPFASFFGHRVAVFPVWLTAKIAFLRQATANADHKRQQRTVCVWLAHAALPLAGVGWSQAAISRRQISSVGLVAPDFHR